MFPPLTQILRPLYYGPMCCTAGKGLTNTNVAAAFATVQIMVGLFNIGLGPGRTSTHPWDVTNLGAAYWLGAVYITSGIVSLVYRPSGHWIGFTAFVNIVAALFSFVGIVLYVIDLGDPSLARMCRPNCRSVERHDDKCQYVAMLAKKLLFGIDITLIALAVLQLWACISLAVYFITASTRREKEEVGDDAHQSVLKEVMTSPGA